MTWAFEIEHIAGILEGSATIEPGLNAVQASNWQGKSSFIEAVQTALGTAATLTEGRDEGRVRAETPETVVDLDLGRSDGEVTVDGEPYLTDQYDVVRASLFACLGERNAVRRAVREGENLEDVLLRPLDFQDIDARIADLTRERERIDTELAQATEATKRLPTIQERVTQLESEIEALRAERESLSKSPATDGPDSDGSPESIRDELSQARMQREQAESRIERLANAIEQTESRLEERRDELAALEVPDDADVESELAEARESRQELERVIEVLQSVYSANEMVLEGNRLDLITDVERELPGDSVVCWTCGTEASRSALEARLEALGERLSEERTRLEEYRDRVETLEARREEITRAARRRRELRREISDLEERVADRTQRLEESRDEYERAAERVESLSESIDEAVDRVTDVESEIKYREAELQDAEDELAQLESRANRVDRLEDERAAISDEIEDLRTRKAEIKRRAREEFSDAIEEISGRFETGFESAHLTGNFDLVVARDGREAALDTLSEGELELIGFIAALAGFVSFDVDEIVPLMLVDGVGSLADENLHTLVEYLIERTEYLVFTTYPEHTPFDATRIDPTEWTVASRQSIGST